MRASKAAGLRTVLVMAALGSGAAAAQEPAASPTPSPAKSQVELHRPPAAPVDSSTRTVKLPGPARTASAASADAGVLKMMRALALGNGEARVALGTEQRTLRPGDVVAGDLVRLIGDGRIVLARPDPQGGESTVVVTFDAQGKAIVRVISLRDRTTVPLAVK